MMRFASRHHWTRWSLGCLLTVAAIPVALVACSGPQAPEPVTVGVAPATATLHVGQAAVFTATVTGAGATVTWSADCGELEPNGASADYRAPWAPDTCTVTATSTVDPSASDSASVTVTRVPDADNLLPNPGFDADLGGWTVIEDAGVPRTIWSEDDVIDSGASGSAEVSHPNPGNNATRIAFRVCLPAQPSSSFVFGGAGRGVTGIREGAQLRVWALGYLDAGCTAPELDSDVIVPLADDVGGWSHGGGHITIGPDSNAIMVRVGIRKDTGVDELAQARVDDLFLVLED